MCCVAGEHCVAKICAYCGVCYFKEGKLGFHYTFILVVKIIVFVSHIATVMDFDVDELNLIQSLALEKKNLQVFIFKNELSKQAFILYIYLWLIGLCAENERPDFDPGCPIRRDNERAGGSRDVCMCFHD